MTALRTDLPELPRYMKGLPVDDRGYPVPFFVEWIDGKPDFRIMDARKWIACTKRDLCWLCGQLLGRYRAFVVGPMCTVNRTSAEPPSHVECAQFAARACPFLTRPLAKRPERDLPAGVAVSGIMIKRNPGVTCVWVVEKIGYKVVSDGRGGRLVKLNDAFRAEWYREGRIATRAEVDESIGTGIPLLEAQCQDEEDRAELARLLAKNEPYLPRESAA